MKIILEKDNDLDQSLSCEENLLLPFNEQSLGGGLPLTEIYALFPQLAHHKNTPCILLNAELQQQLIIARVLRSGADLEPLCHLDKATSPFYALAPNNSQSPEDHHLTQPLALQG